MQALDDDGRERSSHHYVPSSPGPAYLGSASVRWRKYMNQKTAFGRARAGGPIVAIERGDDSTTAVRGKSAAPSASCDGTASMEDAEPPGLPLFRHLLLHGVLRLSVALLVCVAQHERGAPTRPLQLSPTKSLFHFVRRERMEASMSPTT